MNRVALVTATIALAACQDAVAPPPAPVEVQASYVSKPELIPDQYIVVLRPGVPNVRLAAQRLAATHGAAVLRQYEAALDGFVARMSAEAAAALASDASVAYVEQDQMMYASVTQTGATWGIDRIDQRALPLSGTFTYTSTGLGVTAYIIDTGIRFDHAQFGGRAITGSDQVTVNGTAADCNGHGTHVAGTVGGATYGVAKSVLLVAVRVLNCSGSGSNSGVIGGIDWVTANHLPGQPAVANMSLGGGASAALDDAVRRSIADGVTYAVAAGNGFFGLFAQNACQTSPARVTEAITVSATNSTDTKPSWANIGSCVDLFAPGISITSSWHTSATATNTISGTSMATPHVAGVVAQYLQTNPLASPSAVATELINASTKNVVRSPGSGSPNRLLFSSY